MQKSTIVVLQQASGQYGAIFPSFTHASDNLIKKSSPFYFLQTWGITTEDYDKLVIELKERQEELLEQQKQHSKADEGFYITAGKILELASKATKIFENSKAEQKRQLLQYLLQNSTPSGKNIDFTLKKPFDAILLANKNQDWLPNPNILRLEIEKILSAFSDTVQIGAVKVRWEEIKRLSI